MGVLIGNFSFPITQISLSLYLFIYFYKHMSKFHFKLVYKQADKGPSFSGDFVGIKHVRILVISLDTK